MYLFLLICDERTDMVSLFIYRYQVYGFQIFSLDPFESTKYAQNVFSVRTCQLYYSFIKNRKYFPIQLNIASSKLLHTITGVFITQNTWKKSTLNYHYASDKYFLNRKFFLFLM